MSHEVFLKGKVQLCCGDSIHFLRDQPDNRYDSIVTDPPYALVSITKRFGANGAAPVKVPEGGSGAYARASAGFIGKKWDTGETAFAIQFWQECLRVLKPGGHVVAFGGTRTYHRLACAIEDAGLEIRDQLAWTYGTGFNKKGYIHRGTDGKPVGPWGGALKPAWEPICLARKPIVGTVAENIASYGVGALNIDGCRIEMSASDASYISERINGFNNSKSIGATGSGILGGGKVMDRGANYDATKGRWPANLIHDGSEEVIGAFPIVGDAHAPNNEGSIRSNQVFGSDNRPREFHSGFSDAGSAARFFYAAKADGDDRLGSKHPTIKPVDLMQWLVRLVTPKRTPYCPHCERTNHDNSATQTDHIPPLCDMPEAIQAKGQSAHGEVLQPEMRGDGAISKADQLRVVRADISASKGRSTSVLYQDMFSEMGGEEPQECQALYNDSERLSDDLETGSSTITRTEGIHLSTPLGDRTDDRSTVDDGRGGASRQRHQKRQSPRKSRIDAEGRSRQAKPSAPKSPSMPPLPGPNHHKPTCPHCGYEIAWRPGLCLDPFAGTGTTAEACYREGMRCMLVERETEYQADIRRRMALVLGGPDERRRESIKAKTKDQPIDHGPLFSVGAAE